MSLAPDVVGDFLSHVVAVLQELGIHSAIGATTACPGGIAVIIHVHGDLSGVTWRFPEAIARRAAAKMAPGVPLEPWICEAAANELANVLTGRGLIALHQHGLQVEIEPPQITAATAPGVGGSLATELGTINVVFHTRSAA